MEQDLQKQLQDQGLRIEELPEEELSPEEPSDTAKAAFILNQLRNGINDKAWTEDKQKMLLSHVDTLLSMLYDD